MVIQIRSVAGLETIFKMADFSLSQKLTNGQINPIFTLFTICNMVVSHSLTTPVVSQAVYIAPLKALVRERMEDWKVKIERKLGRK